MKWMKWYIVVMLALIILYMVAEYNRPKTIDWTPSYSNTDKIPYGTYIVFNGLKDYFSGRLPVVEQLPLYNHVNNSEATDEVYIVINNNVGTSATDEEELYKYIRRGNTVFIAAESLSGSFEKKFNVGIEWFNKYFGSKKDSVTINMVSPALHAKQDYAMQKGTLESYFKEVDTGRTTILGMNNNGDANFIRIRIGAGYLFLHAAPQAFTNFFVLKDNNVDYVNKVFSYLPQHCTALYWDEYYKGYGREQDTPLRVVLTRANLRWAWYIALGTVLLYILFQVKRRQRIIPVIAAPKNDSKEFVETVSRVYYNQKHHLNIAEKKISYWLDYVRNRFSISTKELNDEFVAALSHRSGVPKEDVSAITTLIGMCRVRPAISTDELLRINQLIDNFYKQTK